MENIFKDKLSEYSEQPPAHVWDRIVETRSPRYIWWNHIRLNIAKYAALLVIATAALTAVFVYLPSKENKDDSKPVVQSGAPVQNPFLRSEQNGKSNTESSDFNSSGKVQSEGTAPTSASSATNTPKNSGMKNGSGNPIVTKGSNRNDHSGSEIVANTGNVQQNPDPKGTASPETPNGIEEISEEPEVIKEEPKERIVEESNQDLPEQDNKNPEVLVNDEPVKKGKSVQEISPLNSWSVDALFGPYFGMAQLSGDDQTLMNIRRKSEHSAPGWMGMLRITKQIGDHFEVQSGIAVTSRQEKVDYQFTKSYQRMDVKETNVTVYHPILPPMIKKVSDTSYVNVQEQEQRNRVNQYTAVSVPLIFRYNYYLKRASFFAAAGIMADVQTIRNAAILDASGEFVNGNEVLANRFNSRVYLSAGFNYKAGQHWSILAEPIATFGLNNQAKSDYSLTQREKGYGIAAGLRYNF